MFTKDDLLTELINYEGVLRTAPATKDLINIVRFNLVPDYNK